VSLWTVLTKGNSIPRGDSPGQRLAVWWGYRLANRHKNVTVAKSAKISPEAKISPRNGAIKIGENCSIALGAIVQGNVTIGENSSIQAYTILVGYGDPQDDQGRISIGNGVRIAPQVMMIAANHVFRDPDRPIHGQGIEFGPIVIEDDVWIGGRANIMAGVTIGKGSVIGAGAVVTRDIPPYSVAVGVPAKVIKTRR
jgi:acetyltransferase-like isoleucine patch superfamily enzyme